MNELKYADEDKVFITIGLDMDGTVCAHRYPKIGEELPFCVETLKRWQKEYGVGYILSTMRSGKLLDEAVDWFKGKGISLFGIQKHPTQKTWTESPKCHCRIMIDDRNFGQPLTVDKEGIPCVDWEATAKGLEPTLKALYDALKE